VSLDPDLGHVKVDPSQMVQVIINLAVNARDAMPDGGRLLIETKNIGFACNLEMQGMPPLAGEYVMLRLTDSGVGMDETTKARVFEPFFTTKPVGKGTGLGLSTVFGIIQQSNGSISVESDLGKGTTFTIHLPQCEEVPREETSLPIPSVRRRPASETVLLVEDEEPMRKMLTEYMEANGYKVLVAHNGAEALTTAKRYAGEIHLVITDVIMPHMSGPTLVRSLQNTRCGMKVLYITGYTGDKLRDLAVAEPDVALIQKPFSLDEFDRKVRTAIESGAALGTVRNCPE